VITDSSQALSRARKIGAIAAIVSAFLSLAAWFGGILAFFWSLLFLLMLLFEPYPSWDKIGGLLWGMAMIVIALRNARIAIRFLHDPSWKLLGTYLMLSVCCAAMPLYFWTI
jgi:hypothetical protein